MAEEITRQQVKRWMQEHAHEHYDCDCVGTTKLAEACADEFEHWEWLDDETHWIWEVAVEVADWFEDDAASLEADSTLEDDDEGQEQEQDGECAVQVQG